MKPFNPKYLFFLKLIDFFILIIFFKFRKKNILSKCYYKNIVILDFHLIGDIVLLTPVLDLFRKKYPYANISLVAGPWANQILIGYPDINIINFTAPWVKRENFRKTIRNLFELLSLLKKTQWDLGVDMRGDVRQIFILWIINAKRRVGFDFTGGSQLLTDIVYDNGRLSHILDHHKRICVYLGLCNVHYNFRPNLRLNNFSNICKEKYIGLHFDASLPLRRMPCKEILGLIRCISGPGQCLKIFLGPGQSKNDYSELLSILPLHIINNISFWSGPLDAFINEAQNAKEFYVMDSGPAHIIAALGIKVTVFYGPVFFEYVKPIGRSVRIVSKPNIQCRPCNQISCTNSTHQFCFDGIGVEFEKYIQ